MALQTILTTPENEESLQNIYDFLLNTWGQKIAENFLELVDHRVAQISKNPNIAPLIRKANYRKIVLHKNISLYYENEGRYTHLLLFWDNRQDPKELTKKLSSL